MAQADVSSYQPSEWTDQIHKLNHQIHNLNHQLHKFNQLVSVLAATLPFKQAEVSPDLFDLAINQTQKRWAWFVRSRELDIERGTDLGTLGYLPWEIRQQIIKAVLDGFFEGEHDRVGHTLCYEPSTALAPDLFNFSYYRMGMENCRMNWDAYSGVPGLRHSSATLGFEYDSFFLSNTIFKFNRPTGLGKFLDQLSDYHQTKLRRILINIWVPCGCCSHRLGEDWEDPWKRACFQLPASLRRVSFQLDPSRPRNHARSCKDRGSSRRSTEIRATTNLVEVLSKRIARSAPDAVIEMHESAKKNLLPEQLQLFEAAVHDIER